MRRQIESNEQRVGRAARPGAARAHGADLHPLHPRRRRRAHRLGARRPRRRAPPDPRQLRGRRRQPRSPSPPSSARSPARSPTQARRRLRRHRRPPAGRGKRLRRLTTARATRSARTSARTGRRSPHLTIVQERRSRMSAITAALSRSTGWPSEGDLAPDPAAPLELETRRRSDRAARRQADLPAVPARPADRRARAARCSTWTTRPQSSFLRLIGPPGAGKSQIARAIAYRLWTGRGREVDRPARRPVLRVRRAAAGAVVGRVLLPLRLRPGRRRAAGRCSWSTRRSCRRCARGGW